MVISSISSEIKDEVIEIDPYIPLKIKWGTWNVVKEPTYYWRAGDFKKSLVEIGFSSKSGEIRSFTLVEANNIKMDSPFVFDDEIQRLTGSPVFNLDLWENEIRVDVNEVIDVYLHDDNITVNFSKSHLSKILLTGRVGLGLNETNDLCLLTVNLSFKQSQELREVLSQ